MKIKHELKLSDVYMSRNVRSDLASEVKKYWLGKKKSNIGLQYLDLKDGIIHADVGMWERTDILMFQHPKAFNVFVEADGSCTWNVFDGCEVSDNERRTVETYIRKKVRQPDTAAYVTHERKFLLDKPWLQVDGMTPEQAIAKFAELGFPAQT